MAVQVWEGAPDEAAAAVPVLADANITVHAIPLLRRPWTPLSPTAAADDVADRQTKAALVSSVFTGRVVSPFAAEGGVALDDAGGADEPAGARPSSPAPPAAAAVEEATGRKRGLGESDSDGPLANKTRRRPWRTEPLTVPAAPHDDRVYAYTVRVAGLPGKFDLARAQALGVPRGPLYRQLVQGEAVTLPDGRVVQPSDCVGPARPGPVLCQPPVPTRAPRMPTYTCACPCLSLCAGCGDGSSCCLCTVQRWRISMRSCSRRHCGRRSGTVRRPPCSRTYVDDRRRRAKNVDPEMCVCACGPFWVMERAR
jgi:hypothetical protein